MPPRLYLTAAILAFACLLALPVPPTRAGTINLGQAGDYGLLFTGYGGNTLQITNTSITGDVGVGYSGQAHLNGPGTLGGRLDVAAANTSQVSGSNVIISGGIVYNVSPVNSALQTMSALNLALGAVTGTNVNINNSMTIDISTGALASGAGYTNARFFDVTGYNLGNDRTLTLQGNGAGDAVVLNFTSNTNFHGQVALTGGLTSDKVIFNFVGGTAYDPITRTGGTGGPTLEINNQGDGAHPYNMVQGIFLDPNGPISVVSARIEGRVFGGDRQDFQYCSGSSLITPDDNIGSTSLNTPEPTTLAMGLVGIGSFGVWRLRRRWSAVSAVYS